MIRDYILSPIDTYQAPQQFGDVRVAQLGRRFCVPGSVIDTHIHLNLFELTIVTEGKAVVSTNGIPVPVEAGDIYLSLPADAHKIESDVEKPLKYDFFAFTCQNEDLQAELEHIVENYHAATARIFQDERIRLLVSNAISEVGQQQIYGKELLHAIFQQILIYIVRGFRTMEPPKHSAAATQSDILCHRLMNYIDTHIYTLKKLEDLTAITDYSYGYLSTLFKKTTSCTLSDYYHKKKLDAARLLISSGNHTITQIAEMLNYTSVYSFSKAFFNCYGVSPRKYQQSK